MKLGNHGTGNLHCTPVVFNIYGNNPKSCPECLLATHVLKRLLSKNIFFILCFFCFFYIIRLKFGFRVMPNTVWRLKHLECLAPFYEEKQAVFNKTTNYTNSLIATHSYSLKTRFWVTIQGLRITALHSCPYIYRKLYMLASVGWHLLSIHSISTVLIEDSNSQIYSSLTVCWWKFCTCQ